MSLALPRRRPRRLLLHPSRLRRLRRNRVALARSWAAKLA